MAFEVPAYVTDAILLISTIIEIFGILLIIFAVAHSIYRIIKIEVFHDKRFQEYENTKRTLIQKIILALDFFVASDLITLAFASTLFEIVNIALIVAIRTVLSWSLSKEIPLHRE